MDRDRPPHQSPPSQHCLSPSPCVLVSQLTLSGQTLRMLWASHKIVPFFWTRHWQGAVWPRPRKGQFTEHDAVTVICSVPDAVDCLHHLGIVHSNLKYACFPLSSPSLHLLYRPENILCHSNDLSSSALTCKSSSISHPWPPLFTEKNSPILPTSNSHLSPTLLTSCPQSCKKKNTSHGKRVGIWCTGMIASRRIHKQNTSSLLSLCTAIVTYGYLSFFPTIPSPLPRKAPTSKSSLRSHTGTRFLINPSLLSGVSPPSITPSSHRPGGFTRPLAYLTTATAAAAVSHIDLPPPSDKAGVLEQNGTVP